jgi:hypothetical protein
VLRDDVRGRRRELIPAGVDGQRAAAVGRFDELGTGGCCGSRPRVGTCVLTSPCGVCRRSVRHSQGATPWAARTTRRSERRRGPGRPAIVRRGDPTRRARPRGSSGPALRSLRQSQSRCRPMSWLPRGSVLRPTQGRAPTTRAQPPWRLGGAMTRQGAGCTRRPQVAGADVVERPAGTAGLRLGRPADGGIQSGARPGSEAAPTGPGVPCAEAGAPWQPGGGMGAAAAHARRQVSRLDRRGWVSAWLTPAAETSKSSSCTHGRRPAAVPLVRDVRAALDTGGRTPMAAAGDRGAGGALRAPVGPRHGGCRRRVYGCGRLCVRTPGSPILSAPESLHDAMAGRRR